MIQLPPVAILDREQIDAADKIVEQINAEADSYDVRWRAGEITVDVHGLVKEPIVEFEFRSKTEQTWFCCMKLSPVLLPDHQIAMKNYIVRELNKWLNSRKGEQP